MKNNIFKFFLILIINNLIFLNLNAYEQFNFDITEVEILNNGNEFVGKKRGKITTNDNIIINADNFKYNKTLNILNVFGNVIIEDLNNNYVIFSNQVNYFKNDEKIISSGPTQIIVNSKYNFNSKNVQFLRNEMEFSSNDYSTIADDKSNYYELSKFKYFSNTKNLKGENIKITTNYKKKNSDNFFFKNAFINFNDNSFIAEKTTVLLHNDIFETERKKFTVLENEKLNSIFEDYYQENNPRLEGISSSGGNNKTIINKGIFTSCKKNDNCPPWSLKSKKIIHDKIKKQIEYNHAVLNIYDFPVFYFPKFFHPDPTVERKSGFLRPQINNSNILGSAIYLPYYHVISDNKDLTFKPTIFDNNTKIFQNEYRQKNKNSYLEADFGLTSNYQSSISNSKKNTISHLFAKFNMDLDIEKYSSSDLNLFLERVSNDNYLNVFENYLFQTPLKPKKKESLHSGAYLVLDNENYNFSSGFSVYETLAGSSSDRYQYVLPYYSFGKDYIIEKTGTLNFSSSGSNNLTNTNNLKSRIINTINFSTIDYFSNVGLKNNFYINLKNLNTVAKNDTTYKSTPQTLMMGSVGVNSSWPLRNFGNNNFAEYIIPKISLRASPNEIKDYSLSSRRIDNTNIFNTDRLSISDAVEPGESLTIGIDYRKNNLTDLEKYFELQLATNFRLKEENDIPDSTTLNQKSSNVFGVITNNLSDEINIKYSFSIDNDLNTMEYNSLNTIFSINNFVTEFDYTKSSGKLGNSDSISNTTSVKLNDNNYILFGTRKNRLINLTEYYNLVYEYKNDCLTAGVNYQKTYYSNNDLKPSEDLFFTLTLFPLTNLEQKVNNNLYR